MKTDLSQYGINIEPGQTRTTCPECSPHRRKAYDKCLSVDTDRGVWFCHHCGWSGGVGDGDRGEEARRHFTKPHFVESEITDTKVIGWFKGRGISVPTLAAMKVKSGPAWMQAKGDMEAGQVNTIQFPYYLDGQVVNVKYRTGDKRFRQEKSAKKCLYNFDGAMKSTADRLIIVEGEMDVLALYEAGYKAVVSVPDGAPTPNTQNYTSKFDFLTGAEPLLDKFELIIIATDDDAPGKRLEEELGRRIGIERCMRVTWPDGCKDANDVLLAKGVAVLQRVIESATLYPIDGVSGVEDLWSAAIDRLDNPEVGGAECGWLNTIGKLNVEPGQMTVVTGIPSHGKSTWVDALRVNLFREHGWSSAAFSPENWPAHDHLLALAQMYASENVFRLGGDGVAGILDKMCGGFFFIQPERDSDMMSVEAIMARARRLVYQHGIKILVIDPWNEVEHEQKASEREDQYISRQLAAIRRFARQHQVHVFLIAHPTKLPKEKDGTYAPPTPYDIAGGAMWRNKADNCLCVYRPDLGSSITEVYVQKIRYRRNGQAGATLRFKFHVDTTTYHPETGEHASSWGEGDSHWQA